MADYRVNLRSSPRLIESAAEFQLANRERLEAKELKKKVKKKVEKEIEKEIIANPAKQKKEEGGLLRFNRKENYKVWTQRKRRGGGGFLLVPDKAPIGEFIELETGGDFDNSSFGNNGFPEFEESVATGTKNNQYYYFEFTSKPGYVYTQTGLLLAANQSLTNRSGVVTQTNYELNPWQDFATMAFFFHKATTEGKLESQFFDNLNNSQYNNALLNHVILTGQFTGSRANEVFQGENKRLDSNSLQIVQANSLNIFYEESLYKTCTFETIVFLGSTPSENQTKPKLRGFLSGSPLDTPELQEFSDENFLYDYSAQVFFNESLNLVVFGVSASQADRDMFSNGDKVYLFTGNSIIGTQILNENSEETGIVNTKPYYITQMQTNSTGLKINFQLLEEPNSTSPVNILKSSSSLHDIRVTPYRTYCRSYPGEILYNPNGSIKEYKIYNSNSEAVKKEVEYESVVNTIYGQFKSEINITLGGVQFNCYYNSMLVPGFWQLSITADNLGIDIYLEKFAQGNTEHHFAIQYIEQSIFVFVDGQLMLSTQAPITERNKYTHLTSVASLASENVYWPDDDLFDAMPVYGVTRWLIRDQGTFSYYYVSFPSLEGIIGYQRQYAPIRHRIFSTQEMQTGFHSLRFTPEQALYTQNFTPPTRITELA